MRADYQSIGSNGFAQVGQDDYREKAMIELKYLKGIAERDYPIPEQLHGQVEFRIKSFPHDFGRYHELCVVYNDELNITGHEEEQLPLTDMFWEWFNEVECMDLESEDFTQAITTLYNASLNLDLGEHFTVVKKAS